MDALDLHKGSGQPITGPADVARTALRVYWAHTPEDILAAQQLRWRVFAQELGACLRPPQGTPGGVDIDEFDAFCEHLLVATEATDEEPARVVGTYRVMLPQAAARAGRYYSESEFDLSTLQAMRPQMAELGRSCIDAPWRTGGVILMLWTHLLQFLQANSVRYAIGCASMPMHDGGLNAARIWKDVQKAHLSPPDQRVRAHTPLPVERLESDGPTEWPPLVKGYIRCGAKVMGAPAWDADFGTADLPMLLDLQHLAPSYRKRFATG